MVIRHYIAKGKIRIFPHCVEHRIELMIIHEVCDWQTVPRLLTWNWRFWTGRRANGAGLDARLAALEIM